MSTTLIIILVGVLLIAIAILSLIKSNSGKGLISSSIGVPLGILGLFMIIFGGYAADKGNFASQMEQISTGNKLKIEGPVNSVKVVSPIAGDSVSCRILTMGVYPENHNKDIWVLLKPTDEKYYPQSDHTNTSFKLDGEWQVVTRFGGDFGEAYDLVVYEADEAASNFFRETIEKWKATEEYIGLEEEELPQGAREVERIEIYLSKNCRGVF